MSVSTDCASAIASRPHTDTSSSRATVPISLRVRMDMAALRWRHLRCDAPDYMVRAVSCKQAFHARSGFSSGVSPARGAAVAARGGGDDFSDAGGRRRHAAHRVRASRSWNGSRSPACCRRCRSRLAGRIREVSGDPAIPRAQPRHEPRPVQGDLLVGMVAPAAGAHDRRGVPAAVPVFLWRGWIPPPLRAAAVDDLRRRRVARRGRLVDGGVGTCPARSPASRNTGWHSI